MPTYEYECDSCHRVFEIRQRISDPALTTCDACGGTVRRLLAATPFILKGGGWYVTDYPSESRKKALDSEKSAGKATEKPGDKATEKPAASTEKSATSGEQSSTSSSKPTSSTSPTAPSAPSSSKAASSD